MNSGLETHYFLGANSPGGFYSLYDSFTDPERDYLYIIKGFPGNGKSGFMCQIAEKLRPHGLNTEYIHCSGDPDSLDGVYFPQLRVGFVDGTAPHVIEPRLPGASEQYINLGAFCDTAALIPKRGEMLRLSKAYKALYSQAYRLISAACSAADDAVKITEQAFPAVIKRTRGIISREIKKTGRAPGKTSYRFLSTLSCRGSICLFDTVSALSDRVFLFDNELGLASLAMAMIAEAAEDAGYDTVNCLSPASPDITEHVIIPELRLSFVSQTARCRYPGKAARHIRLDAIPDRSRFKHEFGIRRTRQKLSDALYREAVMTLSDAKSLHDRLEDIYNPHVDFVAISNLAGEYGDMLLKTADGLVK